MTLADKQIEELKAALASDRPTLPSDIVDRLRKPNGITDFAAMLEAANLIERLRVVLLPKSEPSFDEATKSTAALKTALEALADAADAVGVKFFDTDTMDPTVERMQSATLAARAILRGEK